MIDLDGRALLIAKACADTVITKFMTSKHGNALHFTNPLCGESTGRQWIPLTKGH